MRARAPLLGENYLRAAVREQRFPRVSAQEASDAVVLEATQNIVGDPAGAPNRFLFTDFGDPEPDSCYGRCGGMSANFQCGCDEACVFFGDCCGDFQNFCE